MPKTDSRLTGARPMTEAERAACLALTRVELLPRTFGKYMIRWAIGEAYLEDAHITDWQSGYLRRILRRHHGQVPNWEALIAAMDDSDYMPEAPLAYEDERGDI